MSARVVYVITDSGIGGTEKALLQVLQRLDRSQFQPVAVIVIKNRREMAERWEATGVPVYFLGMGRWPRLAALLKLRRLLAEFKPDIVHAFLFHAIQLCRLAYSKPSWRLISSPRVNYRFAPPAALLIDRFLRSRDRLSLCESKAGREILIRLGYPPSRVAVAPNGVDAARFARDPGAGRRLREDWRLGPGERVVGAVGRLHHQKGFDVLLAAAAELRNGPVKFRIVIAGTGPEEKSLRAQAAALQVPVLFLGERTDVPALLSAFDIYVQSSRYEGMSNALLEAMAAGLPCAATGVDGTLDFARDGENLLLARPDDALSLAVAIGYLLEKAEDRRRLGANAVATAKDMSLERMVSAFHEAYERALS